ncbi:MAG: hypothetical protein HDT43_01800 [Ruminococcaceae bacterium]|nr:hypothetical protein [Oscillospiraceae bacterium]
MKTKVSKSNGRLFIFGSNLFLSEDRKIRILCFAIFDTEEERHEWLVKWFEENPEDNNSGTAKFKDFKGFALDDINFLGGYSLLSGTNGVLFTLA